MYPLLVLSVAISAALVNCEDNALSVSSVESSTFEPKRENATALVDAIVKLIKPKYKGKLAKHA